MTNYFLVTLRPARIGFPADASEAELNTVAEHFDYLKGLAKKGMVQLAGRTDEAAPMGLVLLTVESLSEAEAILHQDPAIKARIMRGEVKPFRLANLGRADGS